VLATVLALAARPAAAAHLNVNCNSADLSDLAAAVQANFGPGAGGVRWDSVSVEPSDPTLHVVASGDMTASSTSKNGCFFMNGINMVQAFTLFDFLDADGRYHGHTNVYA